MSCHVGQTAITVHCSQWPAVLIVAGSEFFKLFIELCFVFWTFSPLVVSTNSQIPERYILTSLADGACFWWVFHLYQLLHENIVLSFEMQILCAVKVYSGGRQAHTVSARNGHDWVAPSISPFSCHLNHIPPETKAKVTPRPSPAPSPWLPSLPQPQERDRWLCPRPQGDQAPLGHRLDSRQKFLLHQRSRLGKGAVW